MTDTVSSFKATTTTDPSATFQAKIDRRANQQQPVDKDDQELHNVLHSLDELEKRISSLEKNNLYDKLNSQEPDPETNIIPGHASRLGFTQRKTEATLGAPSRQYYTVKVGAKSPRGRNSGMGRIQS